MRKHCVKTPEKVSQELAYKNKTPTSSCAKNPVPPGWQRISCLPVCFLIPLLEEIS